MRVGSVIGYAEDVWYRRKAIYRACRASGGDYYGALRQHACCYSLAATQVLGGPGSLGLFALSLSLSVACALCVVRVLRYSEVLGLPGFEFYRSAEDSFCGERCRMCRLLLC